MFLNLPERADLRPIQAFTASRDWPDSIADGWGKKGYREFTALQAKAVQYGYPTGSENWLIAAPTSAGKSLLGEFAAAEHLFRGDKVLWLTPTRALTDWTGRDLAQTFGRAGFAVAMASGDHPDANGSVESGHWDVLVAVNEKGLQWLSMSPDALAGVGLVVIDEMGMLRDPERGGRLELILTLIGASPYAPRRIGLCAAGPEAADLAGRLGWRLLADDTRPRPLREGIFESETGNWHWRDKASGEAGTERLVDPADFSKWNGLNARAVGSHSPSAALSGTLALATIFAARAEPTLLFAPSRSAARNWASTIAEALRAANAPPHSNNQLLESLRLIETLEPCTDHALLAATAGAGVAFHHGDLGQEARAAIEAGFADGSLSLLVATPTLTHGLNLRARNVIQWPQACCEQAGRPGRLRPLEQWRWRQQAGRAGRLGFGDAPGRSIVVADGAEHGRRLWRAFIEGDDEPLATPANCEAVAGLGILAALGGGVSRTPQNLKNLFAPGAGRQDRGAMPGAIDGSIAECREAGLIEGAHYLRLTPRGRICGQRGIAPAVMRRLAEWIELADDPAINIGNAASEFIAILALALAAPVGYWPRARRGVRDCMRHARQWLETNGVQIPAPLVPILAPGATPLGRDVAAMEAAWRLALWIGPSSTLEVESQTGWRAGALVRAGEGLAWLAAGLAEAGLATGWDPERAEAWRQLGTRLAAGVAPAGVKLARLRVPGLTRTLIQRLVAEGIHDAAAILKTDPATLESIVRCAPLCARLRQCAEARAAMDERAPRKGIYFARDGVNSRDMANPSGDSRKLLALDLQSPGVVRAAGSDVRLTPLAWDLLAALAESPGRVVTRESLYRRLWPDESAPEPQQLDAHRRRLLARLKPAINGRTGSLIEVIRGIGFRLNLAQGDVALRRG